MIRRLAVAAAAALVVAAPASAASTSQVALLKEMNRVRAAHGLHSLSLDPTLARAALAHSREMAASDVFTHGAFGTRMRSFHARGPIVGENLAWGVGSTGSPRGIVDMWLRSPGHRANLLRPGFSRVGLGELTARFQGFSGANVVTADFAGV